jgi:hypothetical protein
VPGGAFRHAARVHGQHLIEAGLTEAGIGGPEMQVDGRIDPTQIGPTDDLAR